MRILITNDDGINALGIRSLIKILSKEHELIVIAPDRERSATGHALTLHKPLRIFKIDLGTQNTTGWQSTGTPVDCIKLALCNLLREHAIDLIITGINHGPNLGADILYSGTVSAALEGAIYSIPSIAISLTDGHNSDDADFDKPAEFLLKFLREFPKLNIPSRTVININYPSKAEPCLSKIKVSNLGTRMYSDCYEKRLDPRGKVYYWLGGEPVEEGEASDSDVMAVKNGYISVTPIHIKLTDNDIASYLDNYFVNYNKNH